MMGFGLKTERGYKEDLTVGDLGGVTEREIEREREM